MRKQLMTIAAGLALGAASLATPALAAHGHGGGGGGGGGGGMGHGFGGGGGGFRQGFTGHGASPQMSGGPARSNLAVTPNASAQFRGNVAGNNYGRSGNWNHGNWNHGHWHGGYGGGGVYAFGFGPYGYGQDYYDYSDGYSDGCYQQQYVQTVYGPQLQWINVCQ